MTSMRERWQILRRQDLCAAPGERFGTWLHIRRCDNGPWKGGCIVCERMYNKDTNPSRWSKFQIDSLVWKKVGKHAQSRCHKLAMANTADVPSAENWSQVLDNFHLGLRCGEGTKEHAMRWCLSEGLRVVQHSRFLKSEVATMAISQDVRNHRLLMRLTGCTTTFEQFSFTVGQVHCMGTDSYALAKTTMSLLKKFATPCASVPAYGAMKMPCGTSQSEPPPNSKVLAVLKETIEAVVTDAASDEMKAGKLLTGQDASKHVPASLRNVKFHCRELRRLGGGAVGGGGGGGGGGPGHG